VIELRKSAEARHRFVALLINPTLPGAGDIVKETENAARTLRRRLIILNARTQQEIEAAFSKLGGLQIGALLVDSDPLFTGLREQIVALTAQQSVPAMHAFREYVEAGGLMSYGASLSEAYRLVGTYTGRILKGEKPADHARRTRGRWRC
jgi:putative tryptophan/tyrosine transport system substrate-binding protein